MTKANHITVSGAPEGFDAHLLIGEVTKQGVPASPLLSLYYQGIFPIVSTGKRTEYNSPREATILV